jgi:hypothetical protein
MLTRNVRTDGFVDPCDRTERYPAIAAAASKLLAKSFTLDGEAVVCGADCGFRFNPAGCTDMKPAGVPI